MITRNYKVKSKVNYPAIINSAFQEASKVHALQVKEELLEFLKLLLAYNVKSVLEIGAYQGGTARAFLAMGMRVVSVDSIVLPELGKIDHPGFTLVKGDSQSVLLRDSIHEVFGAQKFDLVSIDADHSETGCESDYIYYSPMANKLIAFHDITPTSVIPDVVKVWERVKAKFDKHYEIKLANPVDGHGWGIVEV